MLHCQHHAQCGAQVGLLGRQVHGMAVGVFGLGIVADRHRTLGQVVPSRRTSRIDLDSAAQDRARLLECATQR